jgi:hypothetical protein
MALDAGSGRRPPHQDPTSTAARMLLDHLVGTAKERDRNGEAERLGGLHIDNQFDLCGLLYRQVRRLLTFEDAAGVDASQMRTVGQAAAIAHQPAGCGELAE